MKRLGEMLCAAGYLDEETLQHALDLQQKQQMPLGEVLSHEGALSGLCLYETLARQAGLEFVDLIRDPPQEGLPRFEDAQAYLSRRFIPWRYEAQALVVAVCDAAPSMVAWLEQHYGVSVRLVMCSPRDVVKTVLHRFEESLSQQARLHLLRATKHRSARMRPLSRRPWAQSLVPPERQRWFAVALWAVLVAVSAGLVFSPPFMHAVVVVFGVIYTVTLAFKLLLLGCGVFLRSARALRGLLWWRKDSAVPDAQLPVYTVIVPMYQEAGNIRVLLESLEALDYPRSKLDIKLVLEEDDTQTIAEVCALRPCGMYDLVVVPPSLPRTKPKACNVALRFARGEYCVIYDVEDRPDPQQLRKAVAMFARCDARVVCLQARLGYYNREENLLTRFFALEYGVLFGFLLPAMAWLRVPVPLGGTSNHLALARLRELDGWDAHNVTEDADLGVRLAAEGYRTLPLDSDTWEEAPIHLRAWLKQRARWIKGYMQTWLVYVRYPRVMLRVMGLHGLLGFHLFFVGSSFVFLSAPPLWLATVLLLGMRLVWPVASDAFLWISCAILLGGAVMHWVSAWLVAFTQRWAGAFWVAAVALFPLYWFLHSLASFRAVWQLVRIPYHWDKTQHGLSRFVR